MSPGDPERSVPGPLGAAGLTLAATALLWLVFAWVAAEGSATLGLALGTTLGFGGVGTLAARSWPPPADRRLGLRGFPAPWLLAVALLLPAVILTSEVDNGIAELLERPEPPGPQQPADGGRPEEGGAPETSGRSDGLAALEWTLFAVLLRPVVEEFFFRGVVQHAMVAALGAWRGVAATALLFGAVRASLGLGSGYAVATMGAQAFLDGLLAGLLRLGSGSILPGILLQAGMAALGIAALQLAETLPVPGFNAAGDHTPWRFLLPCGASVAAGVAWALGRARGDPAAG